MFLSRAKSIRETVEKDPAKSPTTSQQDTTSLFQYYYYYYYFQELFTLTKTQPQHFLPSLLVYSIPQQTHNEPCSKTCLIVESDTKFWLMRNPRHTQEILLLSSDPVTTKFPSSKVSANECARQSSWGNDPSVSSDDYKFKNWVDCALKATMYILCTYTDTSTAANT